MRFVPRLGWLTLATCLAISAPVAGAPRYGAYGIDTAGMDRSVKPGDDFFSYANGAWVKKTDIPADRTGFGSFQVLDDLSRERTRGLIEAAAASAGGDADTQRIGSFYRTYVDEATIAAKGRAPVQSAFDRIDATATRAELAAALGGDQRLGIPGPFAVGVEQDPKHPDRYLVGMGQSGLGMPDRDYYLLDTPKFVDTRAKYLAHVATMFRLAGLPAADARARAVVDLETAMARVQWTNIENRDPVKTYNPQAPGALAAAAPGLDWPVFVAAAGVAGQPQVDVAQPSAFAGMARLEHLSS